MTISRDNSLAVYQGIKDAGVKFLTALPETWLVYLLQMADDDPHMNLIEVAKEEEAVGIAAQQTASILRAEQAQAGAVCHRGAQRTWDT